MSKPMIVSLPILLLLLDFWPMQRVEGWRDTASTSTFPLRSLKQIILEKVPFMFLSAASCAMTWWAQNVSGAVKDTGHFPLSVRLANAIHSYLVYAFQTVCPSQLACFAPLPKDGYPLEVILGSWAFLLLVSVAVWLLAKRFPFLAVGWIWYLVSLLPVIGLVQVGVQAHADRYAYLPCIGLYIALVWSAYELASLLGPKTVASSAPLLAMVSIAIVAILAFMAYVQVGYWKDTRTLFEHAVDTYPDNMVAYTALGVDAFEHGRYQDAFDAYQASIQAKPDNYEAYYNLGCLLVATGRLPDAAKCFAEAIKYSNNPFEAEYNLGTALISLHDPRDGLAHLDQSIQLNPNLVPARLARAWALTDIQQWKPAREDFLAVLALQPDSAQAMDGVGLTYMKTNDLTQARAWFEKALALAPDAGPIKVHLEELRQLEATTTHPAK
jgi:tetratricopeptide (TPR) repeat protein